MVEEDIPEEHDPSLRRFEQRRRKRIRRIAYSALALAAISSCVICTGQVVDYVSKKIQDTSSAEEHNPVYPPATPRQRAETPQSSAEVDKPIRDLTVRLLGGEAAGCDYKRNGDSVSLEVHGTLGTAQLNIHKDKTEIYYGKKKVVIYSDGKVDRNEIPTFDVRNAPAIHDLAKKISQGVQGEGFCAYECEGCPQKSQRSLADIVFVVDHSGSMSETIQGVRNGLERFVEKLGNDDRYRFAILDVPGDVYTGSIFKRLDLTDYTTFLRRLGSYRSTGFLEATYDALFAIAHPENQLGLNFREGAKRYAVLLTDEEGQSYHTDPPLTEGGVRDTLKRNNVTLYAFVPSEDDVRDSFDGIAAVNHGRIFNLPTYPNPEVISNNLANMFRSIDKCVVRCRAR